MVTERDNHIEDMLWDYIFVGGGLSASVVSSRLFRLDPSLKILVVEAGPNANYDPDIVYPNSTNLFGGTYDWKYETVPQAHLDGRNVSLPCGKALGGGTAINSGTFTRMHSFHRQYLLTAQQVDGVAAIDLTSTCGPRP